ncbi:MAG: hypothetical protein U0411_05840 [Thermodesulfovibrionales bacterium]
MKTALLHRLGVRVALFPMALLCIAFVAAGILFYAFSPPYFVRGFHTVHLRNLTKEKSALLDGWFAHSGRYLKGLARERVFLDALPLLNTDPSGEGARRKAREAARNAALTGIAARLEEVAPSSPFILLALVSKDGRVVAGSRADLTGRDWSERDPIRNALADAKAAESVGFFTEGTEERGVSFLAPLYDPEGRVGALLYAVAAPDEPARSLVPQGGVYRTEKVELIDREGVLLLTQKGIADRKLRYNLPKTGGADTVRLKDHLYFHVSPLANAPYRLITTVREEEVAHPFALAKVVYFSLGGILLLTMALQALLARRLIGKPVARLLSAAERSAPGGPAEERGKPYPGELEALHRAIGKLHTEIREKELLLKESEARERGGLLSDLVPRLFEEVGREVDSFTGEMELVLGREKGLSEKDRKTLMGSVHAARGLLPLMEALPDLALTDGGRNEGGPGGAAPSPADRFLLCDLLREVEETAGGLAGAKEIEVVADCDETLADSPLCADRERIRKVLLNLAVHAVESSEPGVVTVLATRSVRAGREHLELSVVPSGVGNTPGTGEAVPLRVAVSERLAGALGGECTVEARDGGGVIFTVAVPLMEGVS